MEKPLQVFCCCAHEDKNFLDELKTHLNPLERQHIIRVRHDGDISAGALWDQEIKKHLNEAQIILLLISPHFIHSDRCYHTKMQHALELHKRGEATVIPILLRPVNSWKKVPPGDSQLGQLQALPKDDKPISYWPDHDEPWKEVVKGIEGTADELLTRGSVLSSSTPLQLRLWRMLPLKRWWTIGYRL